MTRKIIKFYSKVSSIRALTTFDAGYYFAGLDNDEIVIVSDVKKRFNF